MQPLRTKMKQGVGDTLEACLLVTKGQLKTFRHVCEAVYLNRVMTAGKEDTPLDRGRNWKQVYLVSRMHGYAAEVFFYLFVYKRLQQVVIAKDGPVLRAS